MDSNGVTNGKFSQAQLATISDALSRFEKRELLKRKLEAEQLADLSAAMNAATDAKVSCSTRDMEYRSLRLELAALIHASEHVAERLLSVAYDATTSFPASVEALAQGDVSLAHVRVIADEGSPLTLGDDPADETKRAAYDSAVTAIACEESPSRLRPLARALAAAQLQESAEEQHKRAAECRTVRVYDAGDGMADLVAHLPATEAHAIFDRITKIAKAVPLEVKWPAGGKDGAGGEIGATGSIGATGCEEPVSRRNRPLDAVRVDVFADLLLGGIGAGEEESLSQSVRDSARRIHAQIQVIVPGEAVGLGGPAADSSPETAVASELVGFGPIDPGTVRHLAGEEDAWEIVAVNIGGDVLKVDRYRPTPQMKRHLAARDLHCRAPGCRVPAHRCDIDHTQDAALGGETRTDNLAHLCRGHHTLKHHSDWTVEQGEGGVLTWTSPTGREHIDRPGSRGRFRAA